MKFFFCVRTVEHPPEETPEVQQKPANVTEVPARPIEQSNGKSTPELTVIPEDPAAVQTSLPETTTVELPNNIKPEPEIIPASSEISDNKNSIGKSKADNNQPKLSIKIINGNKIDNPSKSVSDSNKRDMINKSASSHEKRVENITFKIDHANQNSVSIVKNRKSTDDCEKINKDSDNLKDLKDCVKKEVKDDKEAKEGSDMNACKASENTNDKVQLQNGTSEEVNASTAVKLHLDIIKKENSKSPIIVKELEVKNIPTVESILSKTEQNEEPNNEKSEFLNSICLTPRKSLSPEKLPVKEESGVNVNPPAVATEKVDVTKKKVADKGKASKKLAPSSLLQKLERMADSKNSKRKNREPIKHITKKSRSESPCLQRIESVLKPIKSKTPPLLPKDAPTISFGLSPFPIGTAMLKTTSPTLPASLSILSPASTTASSTSSSATTTATKALTPIAKSKDVFGNVSQKNPPPLKILDFWSPKEPSPKDASSEKIEATPPVAKSTSPEIKPIWNGPFKVPLKPVKDSPTKKTSDPAKKAGNSKKPIIINNVQRPKQADTPRPNMTKARGAHSTQKLTPILPKLAPANRPNPHIGARINAAAEIKEINTDNLHKDIKVYGPGLSLPYGSCSPAYVPSYPSPNILNYALMNSSAPVSSRPDLHFTPIFPANVPAYEPSSPKYTPNFAVPTTPTSKYTKQPCYAANLLPNASKQTSSAAKPESKSLKSVGNNKKHISNATTKPIEPSKKINDVTRTASPEKTLMKRTLAEAIESVTKPVVKDQKVQSLLNSCNINFPSSLSITLTSEENDPTSKNPLYNPKHKSPVNNYIEIVKLPDITADDTSKSNKGTPTSPKALNGVQVISEKCKSTDIKAIVNELNSKAIEAKRQSTSPSFSPSNGLNGSPPKTMPSLVPPKSAFVPKTSPNGIAMPELKLSPTSKESPPTPRLSPIKTSATKMPLSPPILNTKIPAETFQAKFLESILEKKENELKTVKKPPSPPIIKSNGHSPSTSSLPKIGRPRKNSSDGGPPRKKERKSSSSENKPNKTLNRQMKNPQSALDLSSALIPSLSPFGSPATPKQLQTLANNNDIPMDLPSPINMGTALLMDAMARVRNPGMMVPGFLPLTLNQSAAFWVDAMARKACHDALVQSLKNQNQNGDTT